MLSQKQFLVTAEISPPKGTNCEKALQKAKSLSEFVDAINVTDGQSAMMRMGSLGLCYLLKDIGIEPVLQLTCRDRNRIALQSDLLSAYRLGISNILCLTGDHVTFGDHPDAKPVFDLDSVSLLWAVHQLNLGVDLHGNTLTGAAELCAGAVINPQTPLREAQLLKMKRKIEAGARFFQTQGVLEVSELDPYLQLAQEAKIPVIVGILLLKTPAMARYVNEHVPGVEIPAEFIAELEKSKDPIEAGIEIAARTINKIKDRCQGVHIMATGAEARVPDILKKAGVCSKAGG